jgi:hypothetical protein
MKEGLFSYKSISYKRARDIQLKTVQQIRAILRQITSSVSFLPILDADDCKFLWIIIIKLTKHSYNLLK